MVPESYYTALSAILFTIGVVGVVIRRNPLVIFMSIELMLSMPPTSPWWRSRIDLVTSRDRSSYSS